MAPIAILFGALLTALGIYLYVITDYASPTALIPSFFGVALIILGLVARAGGETVRKHAMHIAAVLGLLGLLIPGFRAISALANGKEVTEPAIAGSLIMAGLSGIFLGLCVWSFIQARRARREREAGEQVVR